MAHTEVLVAVEDSEDSADSADSAGRPEAAGSGDLAVGAAAALLVAAAALALRASTGEGTAAFVAYAAPHVGACLSTRVRQLCPSRTAPAAATFRQ